MHLSADMVQVSDFFIGAVTLGIMTLSITTQSMMLLTVTFSIITHNLMFLIVRLSINDTQLK